MILSGDAQGWQKVVAPSSWVITKGATSMLWYLCCELPRSVGKVQSVRVRVCVCTHAHALDLVHA